jgi:hypothetical protein
LSSLLYLTLHGRFFDEFLVHIVRNSMRRSAAQTKFVVNTPLVALTAMEASQTARSFSSFILSNATGDSAVDEFIMTFPALSGLDREYKWFRPMMTAIATELMSKVLFGVKARAGLGASMSFLDMASDAFIVVEYFNTGRNGAAYALLCMLGANLVWQLLLVVLQTAGLKRERRREMFFGVLSVITFCKPGADALRLASGAKQQPGASLSPLLESTATKMGEAVFEAVPGLVLQLVAILKADHKTFSAIASLLVSVSSTAMTASVLFYDMDTDPGVRRRNPKW